MRRRPVYEATWAAALAALTLPGAAVADARHPRLFVLTDIGNEPDDQMSLVRLLVQTAVMGEQVMSLPQALAVYQQWQAVPHVGLLPDPSELDATLQTMVGSSAVPLLARLWPDVCLAATAEAAGLRMVTFDRDFERFDLSRLELLRKPA